jgi:hypothetical protein
MVAQGQATLDRTTTKDERDTAERTYDPLWTNALSFLDFLTERGLLGRNLSNAHIGQFVVVSGSLSISDMSILRLLWDVPSIQKLIAQGMAPSTAGMTSKQRSAAKYQSNPELDTLKTMLDVVRVLPHGTFATITEQSGTMTWGTLRNEFLVTPSADLMLSHGASIAGTWSAVGILDARPDSGVDAQESPASVNATYQIIRGLGPVARTLLGRPSGSYGVTPLLIFREIPA